MSAVEVEIESNFNEETGEIEFLIYCPEDNLFTPSAFGSAYSIEEDIALKIIDVAGEMGLDLEGVNKESFIDPKVLSERKKIERILKK